MKIYYKPMMSFGDHRYYLSNPQNEKSGTFSNFIYQIGQGILANFDKSDQQQRDRAEMIETFCRVLGKGYTSTQTGGIGLPPEFGNDSDMSSVFGNSGNVDLDTLTGEDNHNKNELTDADAELLKSENETGNANKGADPDRAAYLKNILDIANMFAPAVLPYLAGTATKSVQNNHIGNVINDIIRNPEMPKVIREAFSIILKKNINLIVNRDETVTQTANQNIGVVTNEATRMQQTGQQMFIKS